MSLPTNTGDTNITAWNAKGKTTGIANTALSWGHCSQATTGAVQRGAATHCVTNNDVCISLKIMAPQSYVIIQSVHIVQPELHQVERLLISDQGGTNRLSNLPATHGEMLQQRYIPLSRMVIVDEFGKKSTPEDGIGLSSRVKSSMGSV